jgi:glycosyltransferase involved in cell wall biosynthesis
MKKDLSISTVLCGFDSNEYSKDSGGIQIAEISFYQNLKKIHPEYDISIIAGGSKNNSYIDKHGINVYKCKTGNHIPRGGIIDSWHFGTQSTEILVSKILKDEDIVHFTSIGPAINFFNAEYDYYQKNKDLKTLTAFSLHNIHYSLSKEPHDIFTKYKSEWKYLREQEKAISKKADIVFIGSKRLQKKAEKILNKDIEFVPNTIGNIEEYKVLHPLEKDTKVVLTMCRFSMENNLKNILEITKNILQSHSKIKFILCGDGPEREQLVNHAKQEMNCYIADENDEIIKTAQKLPGGSLLITPWLKDKQKNFMFNYCDVFLHPSIREVSPLVGLESILYGNIIVASDISGWMDFQDVGVHMFLSDPSSKSSITKNLNRALNLVNKDKQTEIFYKNRNIYKETYNAEVIVKKKLQVFENYMKKHAK